MKRRTLFLAVLAGLVLPPAGVQTAAAQMAAQETIAQEKAQETAAQETAAQEADAREGAAQEPPFTLDVGTRVQVRYTHTDPQIGDRHGTFGIRRGRLSMSGKAYEDFDYAVQLELAGGSARLLDANVRYRLAPWATLWFGQGKAFFGRQQLNSSGNLHFVDRTIVDGRFSAGRQQGIALTGGDAGRRIEYNVGVYNGNGINAANDNTRYMTVVRLVWTPFGAYAPVESAHDLPPSPRLALGGSTMRNVVGNGEGRADFVLYNVEAAFKLRGLNAVAEFYTERAENGVGPFDSNGAYAQVGYLFPGKRHELAGRYATIRPRGDHENAPITSDGEVVETGIGYSYYLQGHRAKIQTDFRTVERKAFGTRDPEVRVQFQLAL